MNRNFLPSGERSHCDRFSPSLPPPGRTGTGNKATGDRSSPEYGGGGYRDRHEFGIAGDKELFLSVPAPAGLGAAIGGYHPLAGGLSVRRVRPHVDFPSPAGIGAVGDKPAVGRELRMAFVKFGRHERASFRWIACCAIQRGNPDAPACSVEKKAAVRREIERNDNSI